MAGSIPGAIQISAPGFVTSRVGHGVLTFETGYLFQLDPGHDLWVRGPINQLKDAIQPLDQVIEADLLPFVGEINWRFTRAGETVRFERGEPFGTLLPYPARYIEQFEGHVAPIAELDLPGVSCVCPTYARPELLAEAVQSFLQQDYRGPKELIVLNDLAGQILRFEHPEVQIFNLPRRFRTVGEKRNAAVALASHDLLFVWDDDDDYLPHRLAFSVEQFDSRKQFFKPARAWMLNLGQLTGPESYFFHGGSCWSRALFDRVRGYRAMGTGQDQEIEARFGEAHPGSTATYDIRPEEIYYLYRWGGTGSYHLSALGRDAAEQNREHQAVEEYVATEVKLGRVRLGEIALSPRWNVDYLALTRQHLAATHQA